MAEQPLRQGNLAHTIRYYSSLRQPRQLITSINQQEIATVEGDRFSTQYRAVFAASEVKYILVRIPAEAAIVVGFQSRVFKALNGAASIRILWDVTHTNVGVQLPVFNENEVFRDVKDAQVLFNLIDVADLNLGSSIEREFDFLTSTGSGINSSGSVFTDAGYRIYGNDVEVAIELKNLETAKTNEILLGYSWVEAPLNL